MRKNIYLADVLQAYFNEKVNFSWLQDQFINYWEAHKIPSKKLDKLFNKTLDYYLSIKDREELDYMKDKEEIKKYLKILD